jgi:hypothetical protein
MKRDADRSVDEEAYRTARRKLLRLGCYITPAILASFIAKSAVAAGASCGPAECHPAGCQPVR